jgi:hypothetical protein
MTRFIPNKRQMRRDFARHPHAKGLIAEADIKPSPRGKLAAKLLVFESQPALRAFWKKLTGFDISRRCPGVVNALCHERSKIDRDGNETHRTLHGDSRGSATKSGFAGTCSGKRWGTSTRNASLTRPAQLPRGSTTFSTATNYTAENRRR